MRLQAQCTREFFNVAEPCMVDVVLTADQELKPQDRIELQFPNSWLLTTGPSYPREIQCADRTKAHFVSVTVPDCEETRFVITIKKQHLSYPQGAVRHGRLVTAELVAGAVPAGTAIHIRYMNTFAPYIAETEELWLRLNGQAPGPAPALKVLAGPHELFRILAPSSAKPDASFDVFIVSLDRFDNLSRTPFKDERLTLTDGTVVAEHLHGSGALRVRSQIAKPGIYRFNFGGAVSNAIKIGTETRGPYWGDIHIHTKLSHDGQGTNPYLYAREASGLDFAGVADHWESLGPEGYRILTKWAESANAPGVFVTMLGDERNPNELTGHHNIYFRDLASMRGRLAVPAENVKAPANSFSHLQNTDVSRVMLVPHHTGINFGDLPRTGIGCAVDWLAGDDRGLRPIMEIYSHHGQSELYDPQHLLAYEWNRMRNPERRANTSVPGAFYAQDYWRQGQRLGVIASSDEHSGQGGRRHGGLAAVFAESLTREAIFDALRQRQCYATTGERILVEFMIDDLRMGEIGKCGRGKNISLTLKVWGTDVLLRVEILRYRFGLDSAFAPIVSIAPRPEGLDAAIVAADTVQSSCLYYARITQQPLVRPAMAWTSPIWFEVPEPE